MGLMRGVEVRIASIGVATGVSKAGRVGASGWIEVEDEEAEEEVEAEEEEEETEEAEEGAAKYELPVAENMEALRIGRAECL